MSSLFAAFGDVTFSPKLSPTSFEVQQGAVFAEHALVQRAPRIQFVGRELDAITLGMDLHFSFCTPSEERDKLVKLMRAHEAHPLTFGDGAWWGWFVIERLTTTLEQCSPAGTPWLISLQAELKEFTGDPAKPLERPAVNDGTPTLAVFPGRGSLLSLAAPAAGGGVWDTMRQAVSYAGQAASVAKEAAGIVATAREMFTGNGMEIAGKVLGGIDGLAGRAAGLTGGFAESLTSCVASLTEPLSGLKEAVGMAKEARDVFNEGWQAARQLGLVKEESHFSTALGTLGNSLETGQRLIERTSPVLQTFTAKIASRKETT